MSNSITALWDDYETYECICKIVNVKPLGIRDEQSFYGHQNEILKKYGCKTEYDFFKKHENGKLK